VPLRVFYLIVTTEPTPATPEASAETPALPQEPAEQAQPSHAEVVPTPPSEVPSAAIASSQPVSAMGRSLPLPTVRKTSPIQPKPLKNVGKHPLSEQISLLVRTYSSHLALLLLPIVVILLLNEKPWYRLPQVNANSLNIGETNATAEPTAPAALVMPTQDVEQVLIVRTVDPHTNIPEQTRRDPVEYEVQVGDSLYGIASKFGVSAESIFWSNSATLQNDPHALAPGQKLVIPPVDGVLHRVQDKDTLAGIAKYLGNIELETIIFWPSNDIDPDDPQVKVGQLIMVPGGSKPVSIPQPSAGTKTNKVTGRTYTTGFWARAGAGACANEGNYSGQPGSSTFIWPANRHVLSGYDYSNIHQGIDVAAGLGEPIYAADTGVVVFSGWSDWGYGNMIVLDHGNGFQTLYAHLSSWNVGCGQQVGQGAVIGGSGSTGRSSGPHLHFEILANGGRTNPWFYLPPP
jgi:murein DD-endopeptidase MepM/ murein hydrolase activator NlpD